MQWVCCLEKEDTGSDFEMDHLIGRHRYVHRLLYVSVSNLTPEIVSH
jgi:hypothetical protein